jgi:hypothetical protein
MSSKNEPVVGVVCPDCKKRMFSFYRHDYKVCGCPNGTMVDGGRDYLRYGGHKMPEQVTWDDKIDGTYPKEAIRRYSRWPY